MLKRIYKKILGKSNLRFYRIFGFNELLKMSLCKLFKWKYKIIYSEVKIEFRPYVKSDFSGFMQFVRYIDNNYLQTIYTKLSSNNKNVDVYFYDLGANIGLDSLNFYQLFNSSNSICAVEMDFENFLILKTNLEQFDYKKINLINKAVWITSDEIITYSKNTEPNSYKIDENTSQVTLAAGSIQTISMTELLRYSEDFNGEIILKMDIEGAEKEIFNTQELEWLHSLSYIYIEYHDFSETEVLELVEKLSKYGFEVIDKFDFWDTQGWGGLLFEKN